MSLPIYMDHHIHAAITRGLRERGVDVITALEDGASELPDAEILQRANDQGRVIFTHDDDFLALADEWCEQQREFAGIAYAPQLRISIGQAIQDLELISKALDPSDVRNKIEFLPY